MKIAMVASEAAPFLKTGGLGDVIQALPEQLAKLPNLEISLFLPYYDRIRDAGKWETEFLGNLEVSLTWRKEYVGILRLKSNKRKLKVYFIDNEHYFCRGGVYGYPDDGERYAYFARAVLASIVRLNLQPDVIHCHDWQTALIPILLREEFRDSLPETKSIFTIHNIEYQGWCAADFNREVLGLPERCEQALSFMDAINFMKSAIVTADRVSTVSTTYAAELQYPYFAHGLADVLAGRGEDFSGITNGINMDLFHPRKSAGMAARYDAANFADGKKANKLALQKMLSLPENPEIPVLAMVTRLAGHKGIDLLCAIAERLMEKPLQLAVIGTGEPQYESFLKEIQKKHPDKVAVQLMFSAELANLYYAASDIYLMPSKSEPCGLSQLIAMRFGGVPVVHETGGLKDTVPAYDEESGCGRGFTFQSYNAEDFLDAIERCLRLYEQSPEKWAALAKSNMKADFGWEKPAKEYLRLYEQVCGK